MSKERLLGIGPCVIPNYPPKAFTRFQGIDWMNVWKICGPTVQKNINSPLWQQFAAIYLEGLQHGSAFERERTDGRVEMACARTYDD